MEKRNENQKSGFLNKKNKDFKYKSGNVNSKNAGYKEDRGFGEGRKINFDKDEEQSRVSKKNGSEKSNGSAGKHNRNSARENAGSKSRGKALCPVYTECGGCSMLHLPYEIQLKEKQEMMEKLLKGLCPVRPIIGMKNPFHYRNKVHAVFGHDRKGNPLSGIYREGTHQLVPIDSCLLDDEKADEIIMSIRGMLKSFKIRTYDEDTGYGLLRHVLVRKGFSTGEIMVVLVTASPIFPSKNNFVKALRQKHPEITTIVQNVNGRGTSMVLGEKEQILYGKGYIEDVLCGCTFRISPRSFYQINPVQTEILYNKAMELASLTGAETVLDAYCGIGTIGIIASPGAKRVIGVELNRDAVRDAVQNAKQNGVENIQFYCNDASRFMTSMAERGETVDVVFMDPPRSGSTKEFIDAVNKAGAKRIVYISCGPETLARDLRLFKEKGYRAKVAWIVDLFGGTWHVETCVLLTLKDRRMKPTYHIELEIPMETKDEYSYRPKERQATYPKIKEYIKDTYGANVHTKDIAEVKGLCGLEKRLNYNKSKKAEPKVRHCIPEKAEYIKSALNHFGVLELS